MRLLTDVNALVSIRRRIGFIRLFDVKDVSAWRDFELMQLTQEKTKVLNYEPDFNGLYSYFIYIGI